jgi:DNA-binding CsgD family transcriptional regulator
VDKANTHSAYTDLLKEVNSWDVNEVDSKVSKLIEFMKLMPNELRALQGAFYVLDYTQRKYLYFDLPVKRKILGYEPQVFLNSGLDFVMGIYNPADFRIVNQQIFKHTLNFLDNTPQHEHLQYMFTYTYRLKNNGGTDSMVLQKSRFITDKETSLPLYSFGLVEDISTIKRDNQMVFMIDRIEEDAGVLNLHNIETSTYNPDSELPDLSAREKEILQWIAKGNNNKEIAAKLFLSEHSIITHRRNILRKSGCQNMIELIKLCSKAGII